MSPLRTPSGILVCLLILAPLAGCVHKSPVAARPTVSDSSVTDSVNVGYGVQSKKWTGGAVQSVTAKELRNLKAERVEELLQGRFPGVRVVPTPTGGFSVRIRGVSTVFGNKEPLYVIDGMPVMVEPGRGLDWLNPADIERIDVLKNPGETSIYGVRGANGVVLITTKRSR